MKTVGLIGGMSFESTIEYYRIINEEIRNRFGGHNSAKILLYSFNFEEILKLKFDIPVLSQKLINAAQTLEKCGADCVLICTNTMHMMADSVQARISIPLLSIVDATAQKIKEAGLEKVGLLGTQFTMEEDFYSGRLGDEYGIEVLVPQDEDRKLIHNIIFGELCKGDMNPLSKERMIGIAQKLVQRGAQGIILGCTELPLVINEKDLNIPLFDTTTIHSKKAAEFAAV